jgi:hypothetical protein
MRGQTTTAKDAETDERLHWSIYLRGGRREFYVQPGTCLDLQVDEFGVSVDLPPADKTASRHRKLFPWHMIEEIVGISYPVSRETED